MTTSHCPISPAEARVAEAHVLWHQCLESYLDPVMFRANLNATIQSLRNVTFVLQKCKSQIPGFNRWYAPWQEKLRQDAVARWVVDSRNRIVKQGDLDIHSCARGRVLIDWKRPPVVQWKAPPEMPTEEIARQIAAEAWPRLPEHMRASAVVTVERLWVDQEFPDWELLGALADVFGVMTELVADAHSCLEAEPCVIPLVHRGRQCDSSVQATPECMVVQREQRSVHVGVADAAQLHLASVPVRLPKSAGDVARARYGEFQSPAGPALRDHCRSLLNNARRLLEIDGYHDNIVFLTVEAGPPVVLRMENRSKGERMLLWEAMATTARSLGATRVVTIGEIWMARFDPERPLLSAEDMENRGEGVSVAGLDASGEVFVVSVSFTRDGERVEWGETEEHDQEIPNFLTPFARLWELPIGDE